MWENVLDDLGVRDEGCPNPIVILVDLCLLRGK